MGAITSPGTSGSTAPCASGRWSRSPCRCWRALIAASGSTAPGAAWTTPTPLGSTAPAAAPAPTRARCWKRSEEHTSELQSPYDLVCRLLLEKKKTEQFVITYVIDTPDRKRLCYAGADT